MPLEAIPINGIIIRSTSGLRAHSSRFVTPTITPITDHQKSRSTMFSVKTSKHFNHDDKEYDTGFSSSSATSDSVEDGIGQVHRDRNANDDSSSNSKSSLCCLFKMVVAPLVILIVATSLVVYFIGGNEALPQSFQGILPEIDLFRNEDPLNGEVYMWSGNSGNQGGLELTLLNCLDPEWHPFFDTAVEQWDNGSPDSLALSTSVRSPDPSCTRLTGVMKVCNGNYGETGWKGVNEVFMQNDVIVSSTAKMNEFFFNGSNDDAKRQYTMCHEIGHGFGLPHTDERFWNRDQGNCMDYTNRPQNNNKPDSVNFETLASVYGVLGGTKPPVVSAPDELEPGTSIPPANNQPLPPPVRQPNQDEEKEDEEDEDEDDRRLRGTVQDGANAGDLPPLVRRRMEEIDDLVLGGSFEHGAAAHSGWRVLHETQHGRALEMDLGQGFKVQLHFLLATQEDYDGIHR